MLNEPELAAQSITEGLEVNERFKLGPYLQPLALCDGWIRAFSGDVGEGLRRSEQALTAIKAAPTAKYQLPMLTAFVGQIRMAAADVEGALTLFDEATQHRAGKRRNVLCAGNPALDGRGWRSPAPRRQSSGNCAQPWDLPS